jgi:hypothetical protein
MPVRSHRADPEDALADLLVHRSAKGGLRQIDLLVAKTSFEAETLRRARPVDVSGVVVPVATPEDLRTQSRAARSIDWAHVERWARFWEVSDRLAALERGHRA